ncbi:uncharacterized protein LOC126554916 [Aphis gossypii]|uniref:uncharacterized protein LOC126554916 n=1 Tax=Aphis gossypii TaxID=80765 RepID=UPI0021597C57|nr:uncharacterized protein LOC126554916 [Aphis gossypii]
MSNNSTPSFDGYEYRRILEEIPFEDDAQIMIEHDENGYLAITASEDSGYSTHRESQIGIWYRAFSPIHSPATPLLPRPSQGLFDLCRRFRPNHPHPTCSRRQRRDRLCLE